jgi:hypothetical protein
LREVARGTACATQELAHAPSARLRAQRDRAVQADGLVAQEVAMANPDGEVRGESVALLDGSGAIPHAALHPVAQP